MADFFTKPLPAKSFYKNRNHIMNVPAERLRAARLAARGRAYGYAASVTSHLVVLLPDSEHTGGCRETNAYVV